MASPATQSSEPETQGHGAPTPTCAHSPCVASRQQATLAPTFRQLALLFLPTTHPPHTPPSCPGPTPPSYSRAALGLTLHSGLPTGPPDPTGAPRMHFSLCTQSGCSKTSWQQHHSSVQNPSVAPHFPRDLAQMLSFGSSALPNSGAPVSAPCVTSCKPLRLLASARAVPSAPTSPPG